MRRTAKTVLLGSLIVLCAVVALKGAALLVPSGTWASTSNLAEARANSSAALLSDGRILITGGDGASGPLATAEFFNTDGTVSPAVPMNVARSKHISVVLQDGRVLVAGGTVAGGGATNAAEIYDPIANAWTSLAGGMTETRSGATAALLQDQRVFIAGGNNSGVVSATSEIFDPVSGSFTFAAALSSPRTQHAMAVLADGRVLIVGGSNGSAPVASTDFFDPVAGSIAPGPSLNVARSGHSATTLLNGQVLVAGGTKMVTNPDGSTTPVDLATAEIFDSSAGTFSPATSTLATPRQGHLAFLLPHNNKVLIVGGTSTGAPVASSELFTPWQGIFSSTESLTTPRSDAAGTAMQQDGLLLVAGGKDANGNSLASSEFYGFATVNTDASDYAPGSIVTITGTGWQPGETVTLTLVESPLVDTHPTLTAVADGNGNIYNNQFSPDFHDVGIRFYLTAVGSLSGFQAQMTFTDGTPKITSVTPSPFSPSQLSSAGVKDNTDISATNQGGGAIADFRIRIHATTAGNPLVREFLFTNVPANGNVSATWDGKNTGGSFVADGSYNVFASNGTTETTSPPASTGTIVVDNTNPTVTLTSPADNVFVMGNNVSLVAAPLDAGGDDSNIDKVEFYIDGGLVGADNNPGGGWKFNLDTTTLSDGSHTWFTKAFDKAGNNASSSDTRTIKVDNTNPTVAVDPVSSASVGTPLTITGTAGDPATGASGVASVAITITGPGSTVTGNATNTGTNFSTWSFTYTPTAAQVGSNTVVAKATDNAGNFKNSTPVNFTVTSTINTTTTVSSSLNPSIYGGNVTFTAKVHAASGSTAPTGTVTFTIDGTPGAPLALGACSPPSATDACASTSTASLTVNAGLAHTVSANFTHSGSFNDSSGSLTGGQTVTKATPTITWNNPADITYGTALSSTQLNATASVAGTFVYTPAATIVLNAGNGQTLHADFTPTDTANYTTASKDVSINVNKATAVVVVAPYSVTYDGHAHTATVTSITGMNGETGATVGTVDVNNTTHTNAGTYNSDFWSFTGTANYNNIASTTITDTINKANAVVVVAPYSVDYDGHAHTATVTSITGVNGETGVTVGTVDVNNTTHTNAGTYNSDSWSFTGTANYNNIASTTITDTINKANAVVVVAPYSVDYDGHAHTATVTSITGVNGETGVTVGTVDVNNTTHTNAGTYNSDFWSFTGTANYNNIASTTITDTINKANAVVVVAPYSVDYDGHAHTATVTSITGVNGETGVTVGTVDVNNTTHTNAGTYNSDSWSFTGTANYNNIASTTITDTINKANAVVVVAPYSVDYDGHAHTATVTSITGVNGETGVTVGTVDVNNTTHTNAGTYNSDFWSFTGTANYNNIASTTITDTINKANAVVVVAPYSVDYDGHAHTATVTSITGVNGETGATVGTVTLNTTHTAAGTYSSDSWSFTGTANYNNIASTTITDTINKANAVVVVAPYSVTYDGNPHTATGTAKGVLNESLSGLNLSGTTHTNPGDYPNDPWTFTDVTGNYNNANSTVHDRISYGVCSAGVGPGGVILPPINNDGSSVYNRKGGSTIPVKFTVCDAFGNPISNPAAVFAGTGGSLTMLSEVRGTVTGVNEAPVTDIPDVAFRWAGSQWIFNMATTNLNQGSTYTFRINLANGSIVFMVGVK